MRVHMCDLCFTRLRQYELITQARRHYAWGQRAERGENHIFILPRKKFINRTHIYSFYC